MCGGRSEGLIGGGDRSISVMLNNMRIDAAAKKANFTGTCHTPGLASPFGGTPSSTFLVVLSCCLASWFSRDDPPTYSPMHSGAPSNPEANLHPSDWAPWGMSACMHLPASNR